MKNILKDFWNSYKGIIKCVIAFLLFFTSSLIFDFLVFIFNIPVVEENIKLLYFIKLVSNFILCGILFFLYRKDLISNFKEFKKKFGYYSDMSFKYWACGLIVMAASNFLISALTPSRIANNEEVIQSIFTVVPFITVAMTVLTAPFIEEIVFRKSLKDAIKNKWAYILTSGIIFGAMHVIGADTIYWYDYLYIIPYSALGIAFSKLCYDTDNIYTSIFAHFVHNFIISVGYLIRMVI